MEVDAKDVSEASDDSSSAPEEIANKDAKEAFVTTFKAEIASQKSLKEKARKLKIQLELRNIEQKKIKELKNKADGDSSPLETVKSEIDDGTVSPEVVKIAEKSEEIVKSKKNKKRKKSKNLGNSNGDLSAVNIQAETVKSEVDNEAVSPDVVEITSDKPVESGESKTNKKRKKHGKSEASTSSHAEIAKSEMSDEAASPEVVQIISKKEKKGRKRESIQSKRNETRNECKFIELDRRRDHRVRKMRKNLGNINVISDSSAVNSQAEIKPTVKGKLGKMSGKARKRARNTFIRACLLSANKNKLGGNSGTHTKKDNRRCKRYNAKTKSPKNNVAPDVVNHSNEKIHREKRKFEATKNDTPKIKSMKTVAHDTEQAVKVKTEPKVKVKLEAAD